MTQEKLWAVISTVVGEIKLNIDKLAQSRVKDCFNLFKSCQIISCVWSLSLSVDSFYLIQSHVYSLWAVGFYSTNERDFSLAHGIALDAEKPIIIYCAGC